MLKLIVKIAEKLLGVNHSDDRPRADMYLPERLLAMGLVFLAIGIVLGVSLLWTVVWWKVVAAAVCVGMGVMALMCWRNQKIVVISSSQFEYTTMFGQTRTYRFSDITGLRRNQDSMTLFVGNEKVHIESMAVLSERLVNGINEALAKKYSEEA